MSDLLSEYKKLNNSFDREYIFHVGADAGFYSEVSNMVSAILYCLKYGYRFKMYSKTGNFAYEKGWTDFFEPFCDETTFYLHHRYNARYTAPRIRSKHKLIWGLYRGWNKKTFLTYELWDKFFCKEFDDEYFDIPELGIKGNLREASTTIANMIYRFNDATQEAINARIEGLNLPSLYVAMQVRRGDKIKENELSPLKSHIDMVDKLSDVKELFVLTDDYTVISELNDKYPQWQVFTLTKADERGYNHQEFAARGALEKKNDLIKLFSALEIIRMSELFVGTYTTNVGLFLGMVMPYNKIVSIQKKVGTDSKTMKQVVLYN